VQRVSPTVTGITMNGLGNVLQISQADNDVPQFVWEIPQGHLEQQAVARLLNEFSVKVLNADLSQALLTSQTLVMSDLTIVRDGLDNRGIPTRTTIVQWQPSVAQWNSVKSVLGLKHLIVSGWLSTTDYSPFRSGGYSSDAFDFDITP
jgi:hypothetical protein